MPDRPSVTPEEVLAPFPEPVRALAEELRRFIGRTVPTAEERAYPVWRGIGYHDPGSGYFCGIFPNRREVRLGFEHGVSLPDPAGLLTGTGRRVRYVVLRPGGEIPRREIRELLEAALLHGATR